MSHNQQVTAFSAPLDDAVGPFVPFNSVSNRSRDELILGLRLLNDSSPFTWDPPGWMLSGRTPAMSCCVLGDINGGKSGFNKIIASEYGAVFNGRRKQRVYADDHRRLFGEPEYSRLAKFYGSTLITLDEKINVFDAKLGMTQSEHLETAIAIYESASGGESPRRHMILTMMVALTVMFESQIEARTPSAEYLVEILLRLQSMQGNDYLKSITQRKAIEAFAEADSETAEHPKVSPVQTISSDAAFNINWEEFQDDAGIVAEHVIRFLKGDYGDTFGGDKSFADLLSQRFCGFDYSGKNEQTVAFLVGLIWRIKTSALLRGDLRFMFDIELHDENVNLWKYPQYARPMAKALKQTRGTGKLTMLTTHRLQDYSTVGEAGSQVRMLAENMASDIGFFVFTKHSDKDDIDYIRDRFRLSEFEANQIQFLEKGQYGIKFNDEPVHFLEVPLTPIRGWLVETNAALADSATRR